MQRYREIVGWINYALFLLAALTIAAPAPVMRYTWTAWLIAWALEGRFLSRQYFGYKKYALPLILLGCYYVWGGMTCLWGIDMAASGNAMGREVSFIALALIALFGVNEHYKPKQIAIAMVIGVLGMTVIYNVLIFTQDNFMKWRHVFFTHTSWLYAAPFNMYKHRFHYAIAVMVAMIWMAIEGRGYLRESKRKGWWVAMGVSTAVLSYATLLGVGSRGGMVCTLVLLIVGAMAYFVKRRKWVVLGIAIVLLGGALVTFCTTDARMKEIDLSSLTDSNVALREKGGDPRFPIWITAVKNMDEYVLCGKGVGTAATFLKGKFVEEGMDEDFLEQNFHSHQQYLESCIDTGLIGLIMVIMALVTCVRCAKPGVKKMARYTMGMYAMAFFFDSVIRSSQGVITFCFVMMLLYIMNQEAETEK